MAAFKRKELMAIDLKMIKSIRKSGGEEQSKAKLVAVGTKEART